LKKTVKKATKMVEEITLKRKMSEEVKQKVFKKMLLNIWIAIAIIAYLSVLHLVATYVPGDIKGIILKAFTIISVFVDVLIFEIAYRKDNGILGIIGVELFVVAGIVLYMPHIYLHIDRLISRGCMLLPVFCTIYYILKSIFTYIITLKHYQNNLSDVKEIVKEEEI